MMVRILAALDQCVDCVDCPVKHDCIDLCHEGTDKGKDEGHDDQPTVWIYVRLDSFKKFDQIHSQIKLSSKEYDECADSYI